MGRIESFTMRLKGRIVVVSAIDGVLETGDWNLNGEIINALVAMEGDTLKDTGQRFAIVRSSDTSRRHSASHLLSGTSPGPKRKNLCSI